MFEMACGGDQDASAARMVMRPVFSIWFCESDSVRELGALEKNWNVHLRLNPFKPLNTGSSCMNSVDVVQSFVMSLNKMTSYASLDVFSTLLVDLAHT
jgi:hypothetical protein